MHSGFAGGALLDAQGQLIGVATAAEIRGLGVVIPADIAWKAAAALAEHGTTGRGFLGVAGQAARLSDRQRDAHGKSSGLLVVGVSNDSPADTGGILVGDVIIEFDGHAVESPLDLLDLLQGDRIGRSAPVKVLRGGAVADLAVTVGRRAGPLNARVVLVGSPRERERLRRAISASGLEVVDEAPTLDAARALGVAADAFVVAHAVHEEDDALLDAESLTARELDVLRLLAEGLPNKAIAARLGISDQTVKFHVASIGGKLGARNRTDAVRLAIRRGLIEI